MQLYVSLVEEHIKIVYFSAIITYDKDEAIDIVHEIFCKLYDKVLKYRTFYDPEKYIYKNLERISANYKIALEDKYINDSRDVPQIVLRKILASISTKPTPKSKKSIIVLIFLIVILILISLFGFDLMNYKIAQSAYKKGQYIDAIERFEELDNFLDSQEHLSETYYAYAKSVYNKKNYSKAIALMNKLASIEYKDSNDVLNNYRYEYAKNLIDKGFEYYPDALKQLLEIKSITTEVNELYSKTTFNLAEHYYQTKQYEKAYSYYKKVKDYSKSNSRIAEIEKIIYE